MARGDWVDHDLRVDWPDCKGRGLCAELIPERIHLDEWGYPFVEGPITEDVANHAVEAVNACPMHALRLVPRQQR